jgi:uncharacterized membrane protein
MHGFIQNWILSVVGTYFGLQSLAELLYMVLNLLPLESL